MKTYKIEIKWRLIFSFVGLVWMYLETLIGLDSDGNCYNNYCDDFY